MAARRTGAAARHRPVLILGAAARVSVPIARSLRRIGVPAEVATFIPEEPRLYSRAINDFHRLPDNNQAPGEFIKALCSLIQTRGFDMLIPTNDPSLAAITQHYEHLSSLLNPGCPPPAIVNRVLDKRTTLQVARECGIRTPFTYTLSTAEQLEALRSEIRFPVVVKPSACRDRTFKVLYFHEFAELSAALLNRSLGPVLLQEYCPGEGVGIEMLMHKGKSVAPFQHRRLKEAPPSGGVAVMAIAERPDRGLVQSSLDLLRALEWEGVAMVEYRRDPVQGTAVLMEVNGRFWGTSSLPILAGMDFPVYQWQIAHNQEPNIPQSYKVGTRWRFTSGYITRLHQLLAGSAASVATAHNRWRELGDLPRDFSPGTRDAIWAWSDPIPALTDLGRTLWEWAAADLKWIARKLVPKQLLRDRDLYHRLGPAGGPIYAKLRFLDTLGIRIGNKRKVPANARSFVFVCHGNIMRSPMAEAMFKRALFERNLGEGKHVLSAGLHATPGRETHPWAQIASEEIGIPLAQHRAQRLTPEMVERADVIFAMDFLNKAELLALYPAAKDKIFMLSAYADGPLRHREIPDPYTGNQQCTRECYAILRTCIQRLAEGLISQPATTTLRSESTVSI
jgi:predicted ATP-grasp superfamily ATP-dependent carboligase/protein-tyrosine-phosphatase